jgi:hypothetical protein
VTERCVVRRERKRRVKFYDVVTVGLKLLNDNDMRAGCCMS